MTPVTWAASAATPIDYRPGTRPPTWDDVGVIVGRTVVLVGLFSAKDRDYRDRLDALQARVTALGGAVLDRFVQRRGVSYGGVRLMSAPLSRRFLIGSGKLEEIATTCSNRNVDAVVFVNDLSGYQRRWLTTRLGRPVLTQADLDRPGHGLTGPTPSRRRGDHGQRPKRQPGHGRRSDRLG
jgi:hypothetical protein